MTTKKKAARAGTRTASITSFDDRDHTVTDTPIARFNLAKPSRIREQNSGWKRNYRGRIDSALTVHLALLAVLFPLLVSGVTA